MPFDNRETFYAQLQELEESFAKTKPEFEVSVYDRETGVEGYVVLWNTYEDPSSTLGRCAKGGTRITPEVSLPEVRMLAKTMALKNAAAGLPLGGAKSGIKDDPDSPNFEKRYRKFVSLVKPILCENGGRFGGFGFDIGARAEQPIWACDELKSFRSFTGKPLEMGGTDYDVEGVAGLGVVAAAQTLREFQGLPVKGSTAAIQGMGAMGAAVFRYWTELGGKVSFISDKIFGGTLDLRMGISKELQDALSHRDFKTAATLLEKEKYPQLNLDDVLYADVDVLFPSAMQDVISMANVRKIQAKAVVEGANNPCSDEARTFMHTNGVTVIPDFIANPGGIIAAYCELTSTLTPEENVKTRGNVTRAKELTKTKISTNVKSLLKVAGGLDVEIVHVGRFMALSKILGKNADIEQAPMTKKKVANF